MGVRDLIVVQTEDALLVAHRSEAEKIKQLVGKVPPELQCYEKGAGDRSGCGARGAGAVRMTWG